jgi:hypothetical protein
MNTPKMREHFIEEGVDRNMILKLVLCKQYVKVRTEFR